MIGAALVALAVAVGPFHVTTQNVRVGLSAAHARHDIGRAADVGGVVFAQEMRGRHARYFRPPGWGSAQRGVGMRADCATFYDRADWRRIRAWTFPYQFATFPRGHRWALVTVLRSRADPRVTVATVNVHSVTRSLERRAVFAAGMARLGRLAARLTASWGRVVLGGDLNRAWPLRARFRGFVSLAPPRPTGPKGGRPDYVYAHGLRPTSARVVGHTYSDHNGARVTLGVARPTRRHG